MRAERAFVRVAGAFAALAAAAVSAAEATNPLDSADLALRSALAARQASMEARLADWVGRNTGTWNTAGLEAFAELLAAELRALEFQVTVEPSAPLAYPDRPGARTGPLVRAESLATVAPERARHIL